MVPQSTNCVHNLWPLWTTTEYRFWNLFLTLEWLEDDQQRITHSNTTPNHPQPLISVFETIIRLIVCPFTDENKTNLNFCRFFWSYRHKPRPHSKSNSDPWGHFLYKTVTSQIPEVTLFLEWSTFNFNLMNNHERLFFCSVVIASLFRDLLGEFWDLLKIGGKDESCTRAFTTCTDQLSSPMKYMNTVDRKSVV